MMRSEPHEEYPKVNIMLRSGTAIGVDGQNLGGDKGMYQEARGSFAEVSTLGNRDQLETDKDPSMITTFLETCMKLLHDNKVVKGLQELINRCIGWNEPHIIRKLGRHASRTRREIRVITQIDDYEMEQVILDLGSDANVLTK